MGADSLLVVKGVDELEANGKELLRVVSDDVLFRKYRNVSVLRDEFLGVLLDNLYLVRRVRMLEFRLKYFDKVYGKHTYKDLKCYNNRLKRKVR